MGRGDSLIGHLSDRFATQPENLATEALAYLLTHHPAAAGAFEAHARRWNPKLGPVLPFRTQGFGIGDGAIPDLIGGSASDNRGPLLVEVKFWAALTRNQPVTYLRRLADDGTGLLLFLCPEERGRYLWDELLGRCREANLRPRELAVPDYCAVVGRKRLGLTSWRDLLAAMGAHLEGSAAADHRQLEGLVDSQDRDAFLPMHAGELDGNIAHRLRQYRRLLIPGIVRELKATKLATTEHLAWTSTPSYFGQYMSLKGWVVRLQVHFDYWADLRDTPLWLEIADDRADIVRFRDALAPLAAEQPSGLIEHQGSLLVPLPLPNGVPGDEVQRQVIERIRQVRLLLPRPPPRRNPSTSTG